MRLLKMVPDNTNLPFVSLRYWAFGLTLAFFSVMTGVLATAGSPHTAQVTMPRACCSSNAAAFLNQAS